MFTFKQFSVNDSRCAMKVGADSVLLGAWMSVGGAARLLDAGCGCGILALMAAQRLADAGASDYQIDAVDIEPGAVADSLDNFAASPWAKHLSARQISLQDYAACYDGPRYGHIFCNPPYYDDSPSSRSAERDKARSTTTLSRAELLSAASRLLDGQGLLSLVLPAAEGKKMLLEATLAGWSLRRQCFVATKEGTAPKRLMLELSPAPGPFKTETLVVGGERYLELTSGFYLRAL